MQEIFEDCDDLLSQLMNYLKLSEKDQTGQSQDILVDDMIFKALEVIGAIMKDKKYKK